MKVSFGFYWESILNTKTNVEHKSLEDMVRVRQINNGPSNLYAGLEVWSEIHVNWGLITAYSQDNEFVSYSSQLHQKTTECTTYETTSTDRSGRVLLDAYVNLMLMQEEQEDSFAVPGTDLQVRAKLYPDFRLHLGFPTTRSPIPRNPVLDLTVTERGDRVFSGLLPLHQQATFAEHELTFQDLKYWAYFGVTRDWGVPVIAAGLLMASVGLFLRFFCYEKRIRIRTTEQEGGSEIRLAGHSRFFPTMLQDELRRLGEALSHER